jgi:hypothetical protein
LADALGRVTPANPRRVGMLLEVMETDRYPAVRHIAWRSLRRLATVGGDYDASAEKPARSAMIARLRAELGRAAVAPDTKAIAALRARATDRDLEIGE